MKQLDLNPQILLLVFAGVAWLAKNLKRSSSTGSARPGSAADPAAAERTRRVQEDVRRKIAERQAGRQPPAPPLAAPYAGPLAPPVVAPRPVAGRPGWLDRNYDPPSTAPIQIEEPPPVSTAEETAALARQQKLADQLRALDEASRAARARESAVAAAAAAATAGASVSPADGWLAELRQPQGLRRGIILREILGPPICFR